MDMLIHIYLLNYQLMDIDWNNIYPYNVDLIDQQMNLYNNQHIYV